MKCLWSYKLIVWSLMTSLRPKLLIIIIFIVAFSTAVNQIHCNAPVFVHYRFSITLKYHNLQRVKMLSLTEDIAYSILSIIINAATLCLD